MIWSTILIIIGGIIGFLILLLLLVILAPFHFGADFSFVDAEGRGYILFWWLNPLLVYFRLDLASKTPDIRIAGWKVGKRRKAEAAETEPEEPPVHGAEEAETTVTVRHIPQFPPEEVEEEETAVSRVEPEEVSMKTEEPAEEVFGPRRATEAETETGVKSKKVERKTEKKDNLLNRLKRNKVLFFLRDEKWRKKITGWLLRVIRSLFRIVRFDGLSLQVKAGTEDPAIVGAIYGIFQAVIFGLPGHSRSFDIRFEPVFMEDHLEARGETGIRSSLARMLFPVFAALLFFPYISTFFLWRRARKNETFGKV